MLPLYLFSLLVGGALLALSFVGSGHGDTDVIEGHGHGDDAGKFLSLRTLTYFLFVFGGVGGALSWSWNDAASALVFALATLAGLGVAALVTATFAYLARTDSGAASPEDSFVGLPARVVVPIAVGGMGKVLVQRGDRAYELLARPLDASSARSMDWTSVVVVEMSRGTAIVAPLDDPTLLEDS